MRKRRILTILTCLIFLIGLSMLLYPLCSNLWNERRHAQLISSYTQQLAQSPQEDYSAWFEQAEAYNKTLIGSKVPDAFAFISEQEDEQYLAQLSFREDGVMGYIKIPRISVNLPIYHTTSQEVLQKGAGHLQGSSLPVGGESSHCVLSAHRGLPSAALFTDLDLLAEGDHFYLYVLDRVLAYEVDQITEVEPSQTQELAITPGRDYATLVTCTPYGVNTHRMLVRGRRVEYVEELESTEESEPSAGSLHTRYGLWAGGGVGITGVFILVMCLLTRQPRYVGKRLQKKTGRHVPALRPRYQGKRLAPKTVRIQRRSKEPPQE